MYFLRWFLLGLLPLLALPSCQRATEPAQLRTARTAILFLHYFTDSLSGGIDDMARTFNQQNTRYELKSVSLDHEAFKTSIQDTLKSDNPPDLYSYWAGARTAAITDELEPLDDVWQQAHLDASFAPSLVRAASQYHGHKYLLPLTQHEVVFFYNKKVFDALGLKPPGTWAQFLEVCAVIKAAGLTPIALGAKDRWPAQFWFDLLLLRSAPYAFRQRLMSGTASYDDPRVKAVFKRWAALLELGYFNTHANDLSWDKGANEMVFRGEAAMTLMGTWNISYFSNADHHWVAGRDFDFFAFPSLREELPKVILGPIDGLVIPKKASNKAGAKQALVYLAGVQAQQAMSRGSGALAPNLQVPLGFYSDIEQRIAADIRHSAFFAFNYDLATPPAVAERGLDAFSEFLAFPKAYPEIIDKLARDARERFRAPDRP
ncbi:sn-glycerol-3-phosphate-binding periplasmic protein UgpB precursor [mine drainage metagenome]|uniref:sn-glycerol-3-phosphate-binding periplasmic protein UgpB n=1 Tax=mine drainage metagenome TaxID=410659 RepID=A0A1J5PSF6_9ZZZZ